MFNNKCSDNETKEESRRGREEGKHIQAVEERN